MATQRSRQPFSRLTSVTRSAQVRDQLEASIARGDYEVGDRLPSERELSEVFRVSRASVREAVRWLEAVGFVEVRHGNGIFVTDPAERRRGQLSRWLELNRDEVLDLHRVRGALDGLAAEEAAERRDPAALASLREAHGAFTDLSKERDPPLERLMALDVAFHGAVAQASGSKLLVSLLHDLHAQLAESRRLSFQPPGRPKRSAREHAAIVKAIEAGNSAVARRATATHIAHVRELLEAGFVQGGAERPD
jgi:GntR family transcriptional repressor for pyruvate dehydrogenase complex